MTLIRRPSAVADACTIFTMDSPAVHDITPITADFGVISCSSANRFAVTSSLKLGKPVRFPPGRLRLAMKPVSNGLVGAANTSGMVAVAAFAASADGCRRAQL